MKLHTLPNAREASKPPRVRDADDEYTCRPSAVDAEHIYHWLAFAAPPLAPAYPFRTTCELWRWDGELWRNTDRPSEVYSPKLIYARGWRYCAPVVPLIALVRS